MSKQLEHLRAAVDRLELELAKVEQLDSETRAMLEAARTDIQSTLAKAAPEAGAHDTVLARLNESVEEFEASHPRLAAVVRQIIDGLSQLGI